MGAIYNQPSDLDAFVQHYTHVHNTLAQSLPDIRRYTVSWIEEDRGPRSPYVMGAFMYWETRASAMAALGSAVGAAAVADLPNFAGAGMSGVMGEVPLSASAPADKEVYTLQVLCESTADATDEDGGAWIGGVAKRFSESLSKPLEAAVVRGEPGPDGSDSALKLVASAHWASRATRDDVLASWISSVDGPLAPDHVTWSMGCRTTFVI